MRTLPLEPPVELPMGPRCAILGGVGACGPCHWSFRWSSLLGHGSAVPGGGDACERRHWSLRWGHGTLSW
eukprot:3156291-Pyramimonas_sp.AAC.1